MLNMHINILKNMLTCLNMLNYFICYNMLNNRYLYYFLFGQQQHTRFYNYNMIAEQRARVCTRDALNMLMHERAVTSVAQLIFHLLRVDLMAVCPEPDYGAPVKN